VVLLTTSRHIDDISAGGRAKPSCKSLIALAKRWEPQVRLRSVGMDCDEINARVNKLHSELELIDSFERLYAEDEGSDDHVQIGRRARQLRRAEIETELRHLDENSGNNK
jgi:hypothetical protein